MVTKAASGFRKFRRREIRGGPINTNLDCFPEIIVFPHVAVSPSIALGPDCSIGVGAIVD